MFLTVLLQTEEVTS